MTGLLALAFVLVAGWTAWAIGLWPQWGGVPGAGWGSRIVFWGIPCAVYLWKVWGKRWWFPLGLTFPLGAPQVRRTVVVFGVVAGLSLFWTASREGIGWGELLERLAAGARPRWTAPLLEELVFRGLVLSELLTWTHERSRSPVGLRVRFWGSQLAASFLFLAVHLPHWVSASGWEAVAERGPPLFVFSLVMGFVFAHTRSVWPCVALHYLNNEISMLTG